MVCGETAQVMRGGQEGDFLPRIVVSFFDRGRVGGGKERVVRVPVVGA